MNVEPHPYALSEAIEMLGKGNSMIVDEISEGTVLYDREEFRELLNLYSVYRSKEIR
ncbi:MAG: hypothetical protein RMI45_00830 [Ignisphaera sp.]|nr:hypothetical protein [Ignisphaera sp.]MDW8084770.1 hypothetical protein [Ignisphaera sp.]